MALLALGRPERARRELERARDLDVRPHRMTSRLEETLIRIAEERGVPWVDLRPAFHTGLDLATSRRLFIDHLHPTPLGHARIADALMPEVVRALGLAEAG
jgi:lysophospholipase L1-like esterase